MLFTVFIIVEGVVAIFWVSNAVQIHNFLSGMLISWFYNHAIYLIPIFTLNYSGREFKLWIPEIFMRFKETETTNQKFIGRKEV